MKDLQEILEEDGITSEDLDCIVHDVAAEIASAVNNDGLEYQIKFLRENGWSEDEILKAMGLDRGKPEDIGEPEIK